MCLRIDTEREDSWNYLVYAQKNHHETKPTHSQQTTRLDNLMLYLLYI